MDLEFINYLSESKYAALRALPVATWLKVGRWLQGGRVGVLLWFENLYWVPRGQTIEACELF